MSRKTRTMLVVQLRIPQPAGWTQKALLEWLTVAIKRDSPLAGYETQVRVTGRETAYL